MSVARLPVTGSDVFGREQDIAFLDRAWANQHVNIVTIVAWAGVGKSTLVNHWFRRMAVKHYRSAELVFGWPFTDRAPVGALRLQMNFLMPLFTGLEIQIHGSEQRGRREKDRQSSSCIVEPYWFWWPGTAPNPPRSTRRTAARAFPSGALHSLAPLSHGCQHRRRLVPQWDSWPRQAG
jgi:hypothetical protein